MPRSLFVVTLLLVASPLVAAPLVSRLVVNTTNGNYWDGRCPHEFNFAADITSRHRGELTIQWIRSDGATGPTEVLHFNAGNETRRVFGHWRLSRYYKGWEQLRVTDGAGNTNLSRRVGFTNRCR